MYTDLVRPLVLLSDLAAALAGAHAPRTIARAIGHALAPHLSVSRVELRIGPPVVAVLADGDWRCVDVAPAVAAVEISPILAVVPSARLPPLDPELCGAIHAIVAAALQHADTVLRVADVSRRAHRANRERRPAVIARSPAMRAAMARAELVARHATTVVLTGESGTGKEVVAREIHRLSPRARMPLVAINCGAIPESLVESELFGHERGAFTGAERTRAGVFERAHRGTLFLDEVGELSVGAQAKLLRVLQDGRVHPVGDDRTLDVDVRVIAATNRSLAAMVAAGTFREDLYYRLHVFAIELPPLRDRRDDLGPLAAALIDELAAQLGVPVPPLTRAVASRLAAHDWPGNVRELRNVLEAAIVAGDGGLALPDELPPRRARGATLADATRVAIEDALRATRGRLYGKHGAAARLGLEPTTLQSKRKKLGIVRAAFAP